MCTAAGVRLDDVDAVAVTAGPGLAGALLVGCRRRRACPPGLGSPFMESTTWRLMGG